MRTSPSHSHAPETFSLNSLDALRFLASLAIVTYHYFPYVDGGTGSLSWSVRNFRFFVDLFFVISGVVIAYNYLGRIRGWSDYGDFIGRRLARLYPLHLATLLFYSLIGIAAAVGLLHVALERKYDFSEWLPNLFMVHAWGFSDKTAFNYPSWSISAELFAYLCFPLLCLVIRHSWQAALALVTLLLLGCSYLAETVVGRPLPELSVPLSILRVLPSFAFGVMLFQYRDQLPRMPGWLVQGCVVFGLVSLLGAMVAGADRYVLLLLVYAFATACFIADRSHVITIISAPKLASLGYMTYSIYMLHAAVATIFLSFVFPKLLGTDFASKLLAVVLALAITIALSMLSYRYFELPARTAINGFLGRHLASRRSADPKQAFSNAGG